MLSKPIFSLTDHPDATLRADFRTNLHQYCQSTTLNALSMDESVPFANLCNVSSLDISGKSILKYCSKACLTPKNSTNPGSQGLDGMEYILYRRCLPLLQSASPRVRITTIRAIERSMPQSLGKHPIFESLTNDPDNKVQREIQRFYPQ